MRPNTNRGKATRNPMAADRAKTASNSVMITADPLPSTDRYDILNPNPTDPKAPL
jgi:hypothetical protein